MLTNRPMDVLGIGAPIIDHITYVSDEQIANLSGRKGGMETVDRETFLTLLQELNSKSETIPGGCCANTVRGLAHLGQKCALFGKIGSDDIGKYLLQKLQELKIKSFYSTTDTPTAQVISFVTPDGERTCRSYLGACLEMTEKDLKPEIFINVKLVHIEGYTMLYPGLTQAAMKYAKEAGALISLDLANFEVVKSYYATMVELIQNYVDICICNEDEIRMLTKCSTPEEGCTKLQTLCDLAVVHMGKKGACASQQNRVFYSAATPVEHPLDTTAAGDLFTSGFLHGFLSNEPLEICLHYGNLIGAAAVQVQGSGLTDHQWTALRKQIIS